MRLNIGDGKRAIGNANRKRVIEFFQNNPGASKADCARGLNLSYTTVLRHVKAITQQEENVVEEKDRKKKPAQQKKKKEKKAFNPKIIAFVNRFYQRVAKNGGKKKYTPREIERAADTIDKLIRIDGYKFEEVEKALFWALDDDFWSAQVRSLASLRKRRFGADDDTKFTKVFNKYSTSSPDALLSAGKIMVNGKLYNVV